MEFVDQAYELNDYVLKRFSTTVSPQDAHVKNRFIKVCALRLRDLHEKGIYHADLKSNNILVKENRSDSWEFYFIDLDSVAFCRKLSFKKRSNNLAQINASIADCITVSDRLLFFKTYARGTLLLKESKRYFQRIMEIGRKKKYTTLWHYLSPSRQTIHEINTHESSSPLQQLEMDWSRRACSHNGKEFF
jgi:tRNA A-37 threonylcarbamoyl transferase component Bud32